MKRLLPALVVLVSLLAVPASAQDYSKGFMAHLNGDYDTALTTYASPVPRRRSFDGCR
jgi:hypothetical protein